MFEGKVTRLLGEIIDIKMESLWHLDISWKCSVPIRSPIFQMYNTSMNLSHFLASQGVRWTLWCSPRCGPYPLS